MLLIGSSPDQTQLPLLTRPEQAGYSTYSLSLFAVSHLSDERT